MRRNGRDATTYNLELSILFHHFFSTFIIFLHPIFIFAALFPLFIVIEIQYIVVPALLDNCVFEQGDEF